MTQYNDQYKACFCDGSCLTRGICGDTMIGPGIVEKDRWNPTTMTIPINKSPADELKEIADKARYDKEAVARKEASKVYHQIKDELKEAALRGELDLTINSDTLDLDMAFHDLYPYIIKDLELKGFEVAPSNIGFRVIWSKL